MKKKPPFTSIGILNYPGASVSAVYGLMDIFTSANQMSIKRGEADHDLLQVSLWELRKHSIQVARNSPYDDLDQKGLTVLIVPPSLEEPWIKEFPSKLIDWVRDLHKGGTVVCSICAGAFLLARAGLLEGRVATTHWVFNDQFGDMFPDVCLETDKLIIEDTDIITAGGLMAWVNLGLKIVNRFISPHIMLEVARFFLVDPSGREQRDYTTFSPSLQHGDKAILKTQHWLQAHFGKKISLSKMASIAGLGERTFLRRFQKSVFLNPTEYLQQLRVGKARELLESSTQTFEQIAWKMGYEDSGAFRKIFQKLAGLSPGEYRRRFSLN